MVNTDTFVPEEQHFILSSLSPGRAQKWLAFAVVLALLVAFLVTAGPLSTIELARIDAFVPLYATAMFVTDLMTAVLLFAQFSILRSRALLVLASGYILDAGVPKAVKNAVVFGLRGVEVLMAYGGVNEV